MKITDLRCAVIGKHPIVRVVTDEGLYGLGEVEFTKSYLKPFVLHFRDALIGEDPTDVERVMLKIRQRGSFKPYGAAVSAIEHALWDIAGKAASVPVYKLLGGKVRPGSAQRAQAALEVDQLVRRDPQRMQPRAPVNRRRSQRRRSRWRRRQGPGPPQRRHAPDESRTPQPLPPVDRPQMPRHCCSTPAEWAQ